MDDEKRSNQPEHVGNSEGDGTRGLQVEKLIERMEEALRKWMNKMAEMVGEKKSGRIPPRKGSGCWRCGKIGHIRRDCPLPRSEERPRDDKLHGETAERTGPLHTPAYPGASKPRENDR